MIRGRGDPGFSEKTGSGNWIVDLCAVHLQNDGMRSDPEAFSVMASLAPLAFMSTTIIRPSDP